MFDDTILYYPFPIYFFVNKRNSELKQHLELGLEAMIDSGEFEQFMKQHDVTKHLFPLSQWRGKRVIKLDNPFFSSNVQTRQEKYWIKLE